MNKTNAYTFAYRKCSFSSAEILQFRPMVPREENYNNSEPPVKGRGEPVQDLPGLFQRASLPILEEVGCDVSSHVVAYIGHNK